MAIVVVIVIGIVVLLNEEGSRVDGNALMGRDHAWVTDRLCLWFGTTCVAVCARVCSCV